MLIGVDELIGLVRDGRAPVLLDVRWQLGDPDGLAHYEDGHLPGAVYVDLETELAARPSAAEGRHPLPTLGQLQSAARRWGISQDSAVVIYDDWNNYAAARAWWLLRWAGRSDVRLLDGGLDAWRRAGQALETAISAPDQGDVVLSEGHLPVVDADGAAELAAAAVLLDARAGERFRGEVEPIDARAGHIPGARSAPTSENLRADGIFLTPSELAARFAALGVSSATAVGVYCGSGVSAAHEVASLAIAGFDAALYPGSWSQWSGDPSRAIETGA